jgi:hypothetical protein
MAVIGNRAPHPTVVTRLHSTLKRELDIRGRHYVVTLDDSGIRLTLKGHRKGQQLRWEDLVTGEAALAVALNASLAQANDRLPAAAARDTSRKPRRSRRR